MKVMLFVVIVLGILDGIWGNGTLYQEFIPFQDKISAGYRILGLIIASLLSFFLAGSMIDHLETHVISKIVFRKKVKEDDDSGIDDQQDIEELGDLAKTTKL